MKRFSAKTVMLSLLIVSVGANIYIGSKMIKLQSAVNSFNATYVQSAFYYVNSSASEINSLLQQTNSQERISGS